VPLLLGPIIGAVWGIFVEIDDSVGGADKDKAAKAKPKAG